MLVNSGCQLFMVNFIAWLLPDTVGTAGTSDAVQLALKDKIALGISSRHNLHMDQL